MRNSLSSLPSSSPLPLPLPSPLPSPLLRLPRLPLLLMMMVAGAACPIEQEPPPPPSEPTPSIVIGGPHSLVAGDDLSLGAITKDGVDASYTWSSANEDVADVDGAGTVRGRAAGEVLISATGDDTGAVGTHVIVVQAAPSPVVSIAGTHRVQIGETAALIAITINGGDADYLWASDDESVATIVNGVVTGIDAGDAIITATGIDSGAVGAFTIAVTGASAVVVTGPFFLAIGDGAQLAAATVNDVDDAYAWSSSDASVASVDELGFVRARSAGDATITATGVTSGLTGSLGIAVQQSIPYFDQWQQSAHADYAAEPFNNWNEDGAIPTSCARCHSEGGYRDYLGDDGSAAGVVDAPAAIGSVVSCNVCHNDTAAELSEVTFPSGVTLTGLGPEARCMVCHQGRASTDSVDAAVAAAGVADDEASASLNFINIHYFPAGATLNAGRVRGAYQYAGQTYDVRFRHVPERDSCIKCHDQHTLQVRVTECRTCHLAVAGVEDLKNIRMMSSLRTDYDGDGNRTEGIYYELVGVRAVALERAQAYARERGAPLCYSAEAYPYFFKDTDDDGACSDAEAVNSNKYNAFTPRLLRAAYNVQLATKDPGAFAHNAKYIIETLFDSAQDVNDALAAPADLSALQRNDPGHFNGSGRPARNWDADDEIGTSCSKCHGASEGFRFFLEHGVGHAVLEQGNGLDCATCHDTFENAQEPSAAWQTAPVDSVLFPSGITISRPGDPGNICSTCHQGRQSKVSVDAKIASGAPLSFQNIHYFPAGAVRMGTQAKGGYEYDGKSYAGEYTDHLGGSSCIDCHRPLDSEHTFLVEENIGRCQLCHVGVTAPQQIRGPRHPDDTDGDGDSSEPLAAELETIAEALLDEINAIGGACYGEKNPYFFRDNAPANGPHCDAGEIVSSNKLPASAWTPALLKATYNYQLWHVDPGAWAHNYDYVAQLLIDSLEDLGGNVDNFVRPEP